MDVRKLKKIKITWEKVIRGSVFLLLSLSAVYVTAMMFLAPARTTSQAPDVHSKSDYILMLAERVLAIFAMMLPGILEHKIKLVIPSKMMVLYTLFLFGAIYLGEVRNFYYTVPCWDCIIHCMSGCMLGTLGFSVIVLLNRTDRIPINLSPVFIAAFTFCFAVTTGVLWEIYEYSVDGLLGKNMQKFALENGTQRIGHAAISDTMEDLIVDCISALSISALGYLSLKYQKGWIERLLLKIRK